MTHDPWRAPEVPSASLDWQGLVEAQPAGALVIAPDARVAAANSVAGLLCGLPLDRLIGRAAFDGTTVLGPDGTPLPGLANPVLGVLTDGDVLDGEVLGLPLAGGGVRWLSVTARPLPWPDGGRGASVVLCETRHGPHLRHDSTAPAERDEPLPASSPGALVVVVDPDGRPTRSMPPGGRLAGRSAGALVDLLLGRDTRRTRVLAGDGSPLDANRLPLATLLAGSGRGVDDVVVGFTDPDDAPAWVAVTARALRWPDGRRGFVAALRDASAQMTAELALRESQARWDAAVDSLREAVFVADPDGHLVGVNEAGCTLLGLRRHEVLARNALSDAWEMHEPDGRRAPPASFPVARALATGEAVDDVLYRIRRPDGEWRWMSVSARPVPLPGGRRGAVASALDVTRLVAALPPTALVALAGTSPPPHPNTPIDRSVATPPDAGEGTTP